ncbi:MAG: DUF4160 domain-containing protein [Deltaproteobacteria bacterium]|nr:DUF4160 domain-containing protein [Deltaproteobacteria bacterium]
MGHVKSIFVEGLDLWFNSSDHLPPHIHARKAGHWEVRIFILQTTSEALAHDPKWPPNVVLPARVAKALRQEIVKNRAALLAEWEAKVFVKETL